MTRWCHITDLSKPELGLSHNDVIRILESRDGVERNTYRLYLTRYRQPRVQLHLISANIECNSETPVKYYGSFAFKKEPTMDKAKDRIQLFMGIRHKGVEMEWPMCPPLVIERPTESLYSDTSSIEPYSITSIQAYDECIFLKDNSLNDSYYFPQGTAYTAILDFLMSKVDPAQYDLLYNIVPSDKGIENPLGRELEIGSDIITIFNELLAEMNYRTLEQQKNGPLVAEPYESIYAISPQIKYTSGKGGIIEDGIQWRYDSLLKPNYYIGIVDNTDYDRPMRYEYPYESSTDPLSIPNRGRIITEIKYFDDIADEPTLQLATLRYAEEKLSRYKTAEFNSRVVPHHEVGEVISVRNQLIGEIVLETLWKVSIDVDQSGLRESMMHTVRGLHSVN